MSSDSSGKDLEIVEDNTTIMDLLRDPNSYVSLVKKNLWIIILCGLLGVLIGGYSAYKDPVKYSGDLSFIVDQEEGSGLGVGLAGVLGQFGLGGSRSGANLDRILALSRSRLILDSLLIEKITINGERDFFANHIYKAEGLQDEIDKELENFILDDSNIDTDEGRAFRFFIVQSVIGNAKAAKPGLLKTNYEEGSGIMHLQASSRNDELVVAFLDSLFNKVSVYYIDKISEKSVDTYELFKAKSDSLSRELEKARYSLASLEDRGRGTFLRSDEVQQQRARTQVEILSIAYGESIKSLEMASLDVENRRPYIIPIDTPRLPLMKSKKSLIKTALVYGITLGLLSLGIIYLIFLIRSVTKS